MVRVKLTVVLLLGALLSLTACTATNKTVKIKGVVYSSERTEHTVTGLACSKTFFEAIPKPPDGVMRVGNRTYFHPGTDPLPCRESLQQDFWGDVVFDLNPIYRNASFLITKATMTFRLIDSLPRPAISMLNSCTKDLGIATEAPAVTLADQPHKVFSVDDTLGISFLGKYGAAHVFSVALPVRDVSNWAVHPTTNYGLVFIGGPVTLLKTSQCVSYYDAFELTVEYTVYSK